MGKTIFPLNEDGMPTVPKFPPTSIKCGEDIIIEHDLEKLSWWINIPEYCAPKRIKCCKRCGVLVLDVD